MDCFYPIGIMDPRFPSGDHFLQVPCRHCPACIQNRYFEQLTRLSDEHKQHLFSYFVTLTYDDFYLPIRCVSDNGDVFVQRNSQVYTEPYIDYDVFEPVVFKKDVQDYLKRVRSLVPPRSVRYFAISEYGPQNLRPHYHLILFSDNVILESDLISKWVYGFATVDTVNENRLKYVCKYHLQPKDYYNGTIDEDFIYIPPYPTFKCMSKGIGRDVLTEEFFDYFRQTDNRFIYRNGKRCKIPDYYKRKMRENDISFDFVKDSAPSLLERLIEIYPDFTPEQLKQHFDFINKQKAKKQIQKSKSTLL